VPAILVTKTINALAASGKTLTGDLQIIRPTRSTADTAITPGGRLKIIF
jgi:hypothetical protein